MFWLFLVIPLVLVIALAVLVDRKNKRKGLKTKVKHSDIKYMCMQEPPESSRSTK
ncbi:hypothetical protein [Bacillus sp. NEB1478]|uniref:hypothetical protein n=1 Tax=Bacillus sp. NEB1478 TaxID=3073816 RepID=UPI002872FDD0|nr:hypothetical protein [Bacillus sp. NEB1478]WNB92619.1 hypothetical protein RGB74_02825 [Bacillus sp. NEB1478]